MKDWINEAEIEITACTCAYILILMWMKWIVDPVMKWLGL